MAPFPEPVERPLAGQAFFGRATGEWTLTELADFVADRQCGGAIPLSLETTPFSDGLDYEGTC